MSEKESIASAVSPDATAESEHQCAIVFYLGEQLVWQNPPMLPQARSHFDEAIAIRPKTFAQTGLRKATCRENRESAAHRWTPAQLIASVSIAKDQLK